MAKSFSTDLIPVGDRIDAWRWKARQVCGTCQVQIPKRCTFSGSVDSRHLAGFEFVQFSSSPLSFVKSPAETANSPSRFAVVITQIAGRQRYEQESGFALLEPGDSTIMDSGRPWSSDSSESCVRLYLRVPRWFMEQRLRTTALPLSRRIGGKSGLGATLFNLTTALYSQADTLGEQEGSGALDAYFALLAACIGYRDGTIGNGRSRQLAWRLRNFIETHLREADLNPTFIAEEFGITVRHLHRVFAASGQTVSGWIRERRLQQCRLALADMRLREKTITEIALHWGFSDSAHFSHTFKNQFGVGPREFRSRLWPDLWDNAESERAQVSGANDTARYSKPN